MPISELGYRHWEGERVPPWRRWLAITRSHVGIAYRGSKLLRRFLIFAWMPLLYFAPVFFAVGYVADPNNELDGPFAEMGNELFGGPFLQILRQNPDVVLPALWSVAFLFFFTIVQSVLAMLVVAIVAPPLIARDVRSKAFLLYLSKPIGVWEYLLGKLGVTLAFVFGLTLLPALVLYAISIGLSPNPQALLSTAPILLRIGLASLVIGLPISMVALLLSSLTRDHRIAAFAWMALWLFGEMSYRLVSFGGAGQTPVSAWAFLASIREITITACAKIFDLQGSLASIMAAMESGGMDGDRLLRPVSREFNGVALNPAVIQTLQVEPGSGMDPGTVALIVLAAVTLVCAIIINRRVSKPVRI